MEKAADLDELTARVGALELVSRCLLAHTFRQDPLFSETMEHFAAPGSLEEGDEDVSDPSIRSRRQMYYLMIREAVDAARTISDGWAEAAARRSLAPRP